MGDLIDRDATIKAICEKECDALKPCKAECESIWAVKEMPSAHPQWIPVSERLPDKKQDVLVTISDGFNPFVDTDLWDGDRFFFYGNHRVEAWQPLPEPYKGGEE